MARLGLSWELPPPPANRSNHAVHLISSGGRRYSITRKSWSTTLAIPCPTAIVYRREDLMPETQFLKPLCRGRYRAALYAQNTAWPARAQGTSTPCSQLPRATAATRRLARGLVRHLVRVLVHIPAILDEQVVGTRSSPVSVRAPPHLRVPGAPCVDGPARSWPRPRQRTGAHRRAPASPQLAKKLAFPDTVEVVDHETAQKAARRLPEAGDSFQVLLPESSRRARWRIRRRRVVEPSTLVRDSLRLERIL